MDLFYSNDFIVFYAMIILLSEMLGEIIMIFVVVDARKVLNMALVKCSHSFANVF